jgi:hypothetical protein
VGDAATGAWACAGTIADGSAPACRDFTDSSRIATVDDSHQQPIRSGGSSCGVDRVAINGEQSSHAVAASGRSADEQGGAIRKHSIFPAVAGVVPVLKSSNPVARKGQELK